MKRNPKHILGVLVVAVGVIFTILMFRGGDQNANPSVFLMFAGTHTNSEGNKLLTFNVVNNRLAPIMCPDGWSLEFKDGGMTNLSLGMPGNLRVHSGHTNSISFVSPSTTNRWRLVASYYEEDLVFELKVRVDQSGVKNNLPTSFSSVKGKMAVSEWLAAEEKVDAIVRDTARPTFIKPEVGELLVEAKQHIAAAEFELAQEKLKKVSEMDSENKALWYYRSLLRERMSRWSLSEIQ